MCYDYFITYGNLPPRKVHKYYYFQVESVLKITQPDPEYFSFVLNFYAKEEGAKKKVITFKCNEEQSMSNEVELQLKSEKDRQEWLNSEKREFAFLHLF